MKLQRKPPLIIIVSILLLLLLLYLFVPFTPSTFPPQESFKADPDIRVALATVAEVWGVPERNLYVFAAHADTYNSKSITILEPASLSSATIWIPAPGVEHEHSIAPIGPPDSDLHLLNQYTPQSTLERAIARNFYTKSKTVQSDKVVIVYIKPGIPFGEIRANSLTIGELRYLTLLTYPLPIPLHVDF